jgi:hypothetical protein
MENDDEAVEPRECALESCGNIFTPRVHNQRFCQRECTRIFTNARILAQYHQRKNRVMTGRTCKSKSCGTVLSRYNDDDLCASCENKAHRKKLTDWGWQLDEEW